MSKPRCQTTGWLMSVSTLSGLSRVGLLPVEADHQVDAVLPAEVVGRLADFLVDGVVDPGLLLQERGLLPVHVDGQLGLQVGDLLFQLLVLVGSLVVLLQLLGHLG